MKLFSRITHITKNLAQASQLYLLSGISTLLILFGGDMTYGTIYYVATTGNDSNPGTFNHPWRNPQKCASAPIQAGDTCVVRKGTYTADNGSGVTVYASKHAPQGTKLQPITIKSDVPRGAAIIVPSSKNGLNAGFYLTRPYYIIEGFDISGGANNGNVMSLAGIEFTSSATGGIARSNFIHHIGKTVCSDSSYGISGIGIHETADVLVENNQIYSIGRLRNAENGCRTIRAQNDHGIYIKATSNTIVRRNVIFDTNRGWPIHVYKPNGTTTNLEIYHNTFSGRSPTGKPNGHILLAKTINGANIANNISSEAQTGMIVAYSLSAFRVVVSHNLSDTLEKTGPAVAGVTFFSNIEHSTNLGFANKSQHDFRLTAESAAINRGTTTGVPPVKDQAPDIGAFEFCEPDSTSPLTNSLGLGQDDKFCLHSRKTSY